MLPARAPLSGFDSLGMLFKERVQMSTPAFFDIEKEKSFNAEFQFPRVTFCCEFESDIEILPARLKRAQFGKLVARAFEHRTNDFFQN